MKLPEKIEKEKKKKNEGKPEAGGGALERLRQFEQQRGLPETNLDKPECDDSEKEEKSGES